MSTLPSRGVPARLAAAVCGMIACTITACGTASDSPGTGSGAPGTPAHQVRDSAGIRIIENDRPADGSRLAWEIGPEPALTIGAMEGADAFQLKWVEDALRLDDGRIVIANSGTRQLLVFDEAGEHLATWEPKSERPGYRGSGSAFDDEIAWRRLFWTERWPGDSIAVCHGTSSEDATELREPTNRGLELLSVLDLEGRHVRTVDLFRSAPETKCRDVLSDGSIVASRSLRESSRHPDTGIHRPGVRFSLLHADGSLRADLGTHLGAEEFFYLDESDVRPGGWYMPDPPFRRIVVWEAWGDLAIVTRTDRYEIRAYGADGSLTRIVRRDHDVRAPTEEDRDAFRTDYVAAFNRAESRELNTNIVNAVPLAESFPAFHAIEVDARGYLWVREYDLPGEGRDRPQWTVFDPDGIVQGFVETPAGLEIYEIGANYLLGKATDELRAEHVQLWPLDRSAARP